MYSDIQNNDNLKFYQVKNHIEHLIGRLEKTASKYYNVFIENDNNFNKKEMYKMSKFSSMCMGALDYKEIKMKRLENYNYLHNKLKKYQKLEIPKNLTFMYPLFIDNAEKVREHLISKKIYIPKLWPDIIKNEKLNEVEEKYINNILPLPIDQRYNKKDMNIIIEYLEEMICIK